MEVAKVNALSDQSIDIWSFDDCVTMAPHLVIALIVGKYEKDIGVIGAVAIRIN